MKKISYMLLYSIVYTLSLLPFGVLYVLSDGIFVLVYHLIKYRRQIVWKNLTSSFPDKDEKELRQIEHNFYHWLCDYVVETIKLLSISNKSLLKRIEFRNVEEMERCYDEGQNCSAILGHYCNWEWLSATGLAFRRHPDAVMGLIYHPLYSETFDRLFVDIRRAHGGDCIPKKDVLRHLISCKQKGQHYLFGYISDQAPRWMNTHLWINFLNHDTAVFTGGERIMRKVNDAVFYVDMRRPRRGYYTCEFRLITREPNNLPDHEITLRFFEMLEQTIQTEPSFYLWTHNRWKRTKEEFDRIYDLIDGRTVPKDPNITGS
ncbi:MAG: lysophospholipid acyltransferase family protein [Prevotella sp.]|nr:lysophospholipid acyltransferase family protein [Prevotella sp.]